MATSKKKRTTKQTKKPVTRTRRAASRPPKSKPNPAKKRVARRKLPVAAPEGATVEASSAPEGSFSEALFGAMQQAGVTRTELAIKMRVRPPVVTKILNGRHYVSERTVLRVAALLGLRPRLTFEPLPK